LDWFESDEILTAQPLVDARRPVAGMGRCYIGKPNASKAPASLHLKSAGS
jgi:hypothetical protein